MTPKAIAITAVMSVALSGVALAGPMDNAREFQEKAVRTGARNTDYVNSKTVKPSTSGKSLIKIEDNRAVNTQGLTKSSDKEKTGKSTRESVPTGR